MTETPPKGLAVEIKGLSKAFGRTPVLRGLDLSETRMRPGAVRQLQAALPDCKIVGVSGG